MDGGFASLESLRRQVDRRGGRRAPVGRVGDEVRAVGGDLQRRRPIRHGAVGAGRHHLGDLVDDGRKRRGGIGKKMGMVFLACLTHYRRSKEEKE
jgi:hypothetical protein